jgi:Tol biopolymer transport system component
VLCLRAAPSAIVRRCHARARSRNRASRVAAGGGRPSRAGRGTVLARVAALGAGLAIHARAGERIVEGERVKTTRRYSWSAAIALATCASLFAAARGADALHRNTAPLVQVTGQPSQVIGSPRFSAKSNVLLFHSDADLLGNGNQVPQIFMFDLASRAKHGLPGLFQITFGDQGSYAPTAARRARVIAFHSTADLLGTGSAGRQIFASTRAKVQKGSVPLLQVTRGPGESFDPVLNGRNGRIVAFTSTADLTGAGLPPGTRLYRADLGRLEASACPAYPCPAEGNPGLELATPAEAGHAEIDHKGTRVVFESLADVAGTGCGTGVSQIFLRDFKAGTVEQLTCGTAASRHPVFTRDNHRVLFESDADLAATGSTHTQIFQVDLRRKPYALSQLTAGTDGDSARPAPNGTGSKNRFFFLSTADLLGTGGAGVERLYHYDERNGLTRLTDGQSIDSTFAGQFTFVVFASNADFLGDGNDQSQLFLLNAYALGAP